ncbi:TPA: DUF4930 family protein [Staphylococcus aureus]|uniref:DUF4930 family protein n=2 Tax=Staphylococcus aureus TaxID=1280 RepID=UPI0005C265F0|nr:DUF4930 family protein [Staphylococcus aureus]HDH6407412.1 DUF4930 family protein [Staphylococcus aureus MRSA-Lux-40]AJP22835.1 membrane protein [Staphylococcus aureus]ATZ14481.1 DUF4930 domain-containing protein [Staphylococcus aureus]EJX2102951.1 DUF4930 family protein [Staphylococcus aureus]EKF1403238.1 DUF4930 family protein [Staphylococcus aureus]
MRLIFSMIKNIIAVIAIVIIVYIALKYAPFLKEQDWNPVNHDDEQTNQVTQPANDAQHVYVSGEKYALKENDLIKNVPLSQIKNVFKMIDKQEFMAVSGMNRMAYNDQYIIGQRGDEFILYKFGDESMRVYNTEFEMQQDLNELGQNLQLKPENAYQ